MKNKKTISQKDFIRLTKEDQIATVKKLAKRANVRAKLLEDVGVKNEAYTKAEYYNNNQGREKNRFYEGTNYDSKQDIKKAYKALNNFLEDKTSTLGGVEKQIQAKVKELLNKGKFDFNSIKDMTQKEKIYASKAIAKVANKKIATLEENNVNYGAIAKAEHYNFSTGRKKNRFYQGGKFVDDKDLKRHIQNIEHFIKSKTSTMEGIENAYHKRIETFKEKGVKVPDGMEKEFFDFLSSNQFKSLGKYADSNQIIETYVDARKQELDVNEINKEFEKFMNSDLTFDEVQERLKVAKWQGGGLLK